MHVVWIHPHSLRPSNSKHTVPSSNMFYPQSVEFNAFTSHVLSCLVPPPPSFLHTHTHTDYPQDNTARPIPRPCPGLPLFDSFICLFGYQQTPRTQTPCLLYQMAGSRKLQPSGFLVCSLLLLGKFPVFCPYETEKTQQDSLMFSQHTYKYIQMMIFILCISVVKFWLL